MGLRGLYNTRATVKRLTLAASDAGAAAVETWANHILSLPCRIEPIGTADAEQFSKATGEVSHLMYCDAGKDIKSRDEVFVGSTQYRIEGPPMNVPGSQRDHHMEILLSQREED